MKKYAAKKLDDNSIMVISTKSDPEAFLPFHMEQQGEGTEESPYFKVKVMDAELIGELPKDESGQYIMLDREFRNAWRKVGESSIEVDLSVAKDLKMDEIRAKRDAHLLKSDAKYMELLSKGSDLTAIQALKDTLRDLPANVDMDAVSDLDGLKALDAFSGVDMSLIGE